MQESEWYVLINILSKLKLQVHFEFRSSSHLRVLTIKLLAESLLGSLSRRLNLLFIRSFLRTSHCLSQNKRSGSIPFDKIPRFLRII
jgi:hypothetical protein